MKHNWFVKVRNTRTDRYKLIFTPKFFMEYEARDFVKKSNEFDKYEDIIMSVCEFINLGQEEM
jgi:hypothetical protein